MKRKNGTIKKREKHSVFNLKVLWTVALLCAAFAANAQTRYYWVGKGTDKNWSTLMNWSATSGGAGGVGLTQTPTNVNTVVFDAKSGTGIITIPSGVQCDSLIVESDTPVSGFISSSGFTINGSLLIKKTGLTWTAGSGTIYFASGRLGETIQTSGTIFYGAGTYFNSNNRNISFTGSGSWLLADDLTTGGILRLQSGILDLNGKNLSVHTFRADKGKIIFPNSTITCNYLWHYAASSPQLTAAETEGSLIRVVAQSFFTGKSADQYNNVEFTGATESHTISDGSFNKITFLSGSGIVGHTSSNRLVTDSLLILTTDHYDFSNITVKKYFEACPRECGGQVRLFQSDASKAGILIDPTATTHIERAVIQDLKISGKSVTAEKSYSWGNNSGWTFTAPDPGVNRYWIGGGGKWNDPAHWLNGCLPTLADNVIFDANSGTIGSGENAVMLNGDAWCNNMTWDGVAGTPYFNLCGLVTTATPDYNKENYLMIGGSMRLQRTLIINEYGTNTTYGGTNNCIYFVSDNDETIVTDNAVKVAADIYFQSVSGDGKWTLSGNLNLFMTNNVTEEQYRRTIHFNRGHLDISGQKIIANNFYGLINPTKLSGRFFDLLPSRTLNMANAVIDLTANWYYLDGEQLTADQSVGSSVLCGAGTYSPTIRTKANDYYYNVELRTQSTGVIYPSKPGDTFFNKVTVSAPGASINSDINDTGTIHPDSLLFTGNGTYTILRDFTIKNYLSTSAGCGGNTTLTATAARTITLGETADPNQVNVSNTRINNISINPYPEEGYKVADCVIEGTSTGWKNTSTGQITLYWVGGSGNWSDGNHWAEESGGNPTGCIPRQIDDVIFDDGSFSAAGQIVTIDANAYCHDMKWIGSDTSMEPELRSLNNGIHLYIGGSLELQTKMQFQKTPSSQYLHIHFISEEEETIISNGSEFNNSILYFENIKGKWTLADNLTVYFSTSDQPIRLVSGTLDFGGNTIRTRGLDTKPFPGGSTADRDTRTLIIKNATINLNGIWNYTGDLEAENSTINQTAGSFTAEAGARYHNYNYSNYDNSSGTYSFEGGIWNRMNLLVGHRIKNVETDTLSLSANSSYSYRFQDIIRVNKAFYGNGTPCHTIYLLSHTETVPASLDIKKEAANMPGDILLVDYAYIHGLRPLTGDDNALLHKGPHSPDVAKSGTAWGYGKGTGNYNNETTIGGANSWAIMDDFKADDTSPFGDDRMVGCHLFPYLLSSANFVPTAEARFKWFKCDYTKLDNAFKSILGTNLQKFNGLESKLGENYPLMSTAPEFWIDGSESATPYSLIVDYGNGCVAYDDITITMVTFAGCGLIETCVGDPVEDYFPTAEILSTVPNYTEASWVMEDENGDLTGEDGAKYFKVTPSELIMKEEYDGKKLIYYSRNAGNESVLWADTITVRAVPPVMIWQGDESADWQTPTNWHPEGVPHSCTDVYIPGDVDYFPVLENDGQCRSIYFLPGAQLGHPQRLDYDFAHVQMNLGMVNGESQSTLTDNEDFAAKGRDQITAEERLEFGAGRTKEDATLARGAWHALAAPLKSVVTGDYAFGGFPFTYLRKYDINAQAGESFIAGRWSNYFSSTVEELKPGEGFVYWVNGYKDNDHRYMHKGSDWKTGITETQPKGLDENETFGLGELNGMLHLPYFEEEYLSSRHRNHAYDADNGESTFHLFWQTTTEANKGNLMHFVGGETGTETVQRADAYRFITETGSGEERTMDFTYSLPVNGAIAAGTTLLIGNPYVSAIDFAKFHTDNSTYIKNAAQVWNGTSFEIDAIIPPMQSFLVELNETEEASDLELKFKIENISTTTTTTNLKSSVLRATATHPELKITASNPHVSAPAKVVWKEAAETYFGNTDISKIIEYPVTKATPEVYTLKAVHNSGKQRGLAIHSVNSEEALIPVGLIARHNGKMNLSLSGMDSFDATIKFIDTQSGEPEKDITGMNSFEYSFDYTSPLNAQNQAIAVEDRFFLRIGTRAATGMDGMSTEGKVYAYASGEDLVLVSSEQDLLQQFALYDADGRLIGRQDGVDKALHKVIGVLSRPGVYLVRMQTAGTVKEVKVIK